MSSTQLLSTLETHHPSYFICTLGEAQVLNETLEPAPYNTINQFIDYLAEQYGQTTAIASASPGKDDAWAVESLNFSELRESSINLSTNLSTQGDLGDTTQTVACYASSSLSYLVHILAFLRAGCNVALISTACSTEAVRHLLKACKATAVLHDNKHEKIINQVLNAHADSASNPITRIILKHEPVEQFSHFKIASKPAFVQAANKSDDVILYGHSSGTSTGLPKPIPITFQDEIGALPRFHQITGYERPHGTLSTTPIYTGGLADLWRSWSAGTTLWTYPEHQAPITAENILKYKLAAEEWIRQRIEFASPIGYISCVPYVTQMMAEDADLLEWLKSMKMVGVGGAAMPTSLGDMLVAKDISLVSRFGSRECGFLLSSNRDYINDKEWQYLRHDDRVGSIIFKKWNDTDYELIVAKTWPSLSPAIRDMLPFNSHDVFIPHKSIKNAWKYNGRSDVQITLTTGKKFDPSGIESALTTSEWIQDGVVIGNDRPLPAAIIFSSRKAEALGIKECEEMVWTTISNTNNGCPLHARLKRNMITILPAIESSKIQKSSKGTVMRGKFNESFKNIIDELYAPDEKQSSGPTLDTLSNTQRVEEILRIVNEQLEIPISSMESGFYDVGVDSTVSMQIRGQIKARLPEHLKDKLPLNVVYNTENVQGLADFVASLNAGPANGGPESNAASARKTEMEKFLERIRAGEEQQREHFTTFTERSNGAAAEDLTGEVIVLTGATGFLGAHLLTELAQNGKVQEIICLIRKDSKDSPPAEPQSRIDGTLSSYDLSIPEHGSGKIRCLYATFHELDLGLSEEDLLRIASRMTHVIHAAWAVNFSLPLHAYASQIHGLLNLYNLAKLAGSRGRETRLTFISSTAAILSAPQPITETVTCNPQDASSTGYGKSKWAAEKLLQELVNNDEKPRVSILRVGQLTASSETGAWNLHEAWPLMFDAASRILGNEHKVLLPNLSNIPDKTLDWLPVNLAARSVVEVFLGDVELQIAGKPKIFHILSNSTSVLTWADVHNWLSGTIDIKCRDRQHVYDVEFVAPTKWLDLLEQTSLNGGNSLAMSLIPLWRSGWIEDENANLRGQFSTANAQKHSKTMKTMASGKDAVSKESFMKMLGWVLSQGKSG